jgi:hypothetical protein
MCVTTGSGAAGAPVIYTCPVSQVFSKGILIRYPTSLKNKTNLYYPNCRKTLAVQ